MSRTTLRAGSAVVLVALACCACRHRESHERALASSVTPSATALASAKPPAKSAASTRLPEDPAAGARSMAQWREHMKEEERERKLNYDRRKLKEHERVLADLRQAQKSYDDAKSEKDVLRAKAALAQRHQRMERAISAIDHWGVSSNVLDDYRAILETLSEAYPTARIAALSGNNVRLDELRSKVDGRLHKVDEWLERARDSEDE